MAFTPKTAEEIMAMTPVEFKRYANRIPDEYEREVKFPKAIYTSTELDGIKGIRSIDRKFNYIANDIKHLVRDGIKIPGFAHYVFSARQKAADWEERMKHYECSEEYVDIEYCGIYKFDEVKEAYAEAAGRIAERVVDPFRSEIESIVDGLDIDVDELMEYLSDF